MIAFASAHALVFGLVATIALAGVVATLVWLVAHHEVRTQYLEHELARLHARQYAQTENKPAPLPGPTTPHVARRVAQITGDAAKDEAA